MSENVTNTSKQNDNGTYINKGLLAVTKISASELDLAY